MVLSFHHLIFIFYYIDHILNLNHNFRKNESIKRKAGPNVDGAQKIRVFAKSKTFCSEMFDIKEKFAVSKYKFLAGGALKAKFATAFPTETT